MEESKKPTGCFVLYSGIFRRRGGFWHRRSSSTSSLPRTNHNPIVARLPSSTPQRRRAGSDDTSLVAQPTSQSSPAMAKSPLKSNPFASNYHKATARKVPDSVKPSTRPTPGNGLSGELDTMIYDYQRSKGSNTLVRASSGNVMVFGNLGNIRGSQHNSNSPKAVKDLGGNGDKRNGYRFSAANGVMGNIVKNTGQVPAAAEKPAVLCRALSKRLEPEELKEMGNEEFKKGRFAEALAYYDRAIVLDPEKASYRSNKAAALTSLGRILEAVGECKEAVRIDPSYTRAHHRLATLCFRLGEAEKAIHHYKLSRTEANPNDISQAKALQGHVAKCSEARRVRDWHTVLKESRFAISIGADSAPQVFALQAEALIKLDRHDEADMLMNGGPKFDVDSFTKFFGATINGYIIMVQALVNMASGRFEEAISSAEMAAQIDLNNREISSMVRRVRAIASARSKGNDLFTASRFGEACIAYGEGLDHDPRNATLLCNRAICRSKLGHWERAIEDCSTALIFRPSYMKARLRRADCNTKLERWAAAIQDYEVLIKEIPGDEEVERALLEAKSKLKKNRGECDDDTAK